MANSLGAAGGADSTLAKKKVMTQAEGRLADLAAMSGKKKALTPKEIDSIATSAGSFDRKTWVGAVKSAGYTTKTGN